MHALIQLTLEVTLLTLAVAVLLARGSVSGPETGPDDPSDQLPAASAGHQPGSGTIVVAQGLSLLGCSRGRFVDEPFPAYLIRTLICTENGGHIITTRFAPLIDGRWEVVSGTQDLVGLQGDGDGGSFRREGTSG